METCVGTLLPPWEGTELSHRWAEECSGEGVLQSVDREQRLPCCDSFVLRSRSQARKMAPLVKCQPAGLGDPRTHEKMQGIAKHPCNPPVSEVNTGHCRSLLARQPSELAHSRLVRDPVSGYKMEGC